MGKFDSIRIPYVIVETFHFKTRFQASKTGIANVGAVQERKSADMVSEQHGKGKWSLTDKGELGMGQY